MKFQTESPEYLIRKLRSDVSYFMRPVIGKTLGIGLLALWMMVLDILKTLGIGLLALWMMVLDILKILGTSYREMHWQFGMICQRAHKKLGLLSKISQKKVQMLLKTSPLKT